MSPSHSPCCVLEFTLLRLFLLSSLTFKCRLYEAVKQRLWLVRSALELRMELSGDKPAVCGIFHDLDKSAVRRQAGKAQSLFAKLLTEIVVQFVSVAVALVNSLLACHPIIKYNTRDREGEERPVWMNLIHWP